jgi:hypothetical protein
VVFKELPTWTLKHYSDAIIGISKLFYLLIPNIFIVAKLILETSLNGSIKFHQFHKSWSRRVLVLVPTCHKEKNTFGNLGNRNVRTLWMRLSQKLLAWSVVFRNNKHWCKVQYSSTSSSLVNVFSFNFLIWNFGIFSNFGAFLSNFNLKNENFPPNSRLTTYLCSSIDLVGFQIPKTLKHHLTHVRTNKIFLALVPTKSYTH